MDIAVNMRLCRLLKLIQHHVVLAILMSTTVNSISICSTVTQGGRVVSLSSGSGVIAGCQCVLKIPFSGNDVEKVTFQHENSTVGCQYKLEFTSSSVNNNYTCNNSSTNFSLDLKKNENLIIKTIPDSSGDDGFLFGFKITSDRKSSSVDLICSPPPTSLTTIQVTTTTTTTIASTTTSTDTTTTTTSDPPTTSPSTTSSTIPPTTIPPTTPTSPTTVITSTIPSTEYLTTETVTNGESYTTGPFSSFATTTESNPAPSTAEFPLATVLVSIIVILILIVIIIICVWRYKKKKRRQVKPLSEINNHTTKTTE